jgi:hypothetical protein
MVDFLAALAAILLVAVLYLTSRLAAARRTAEDQRYVDPCSTLDRRHLNRCTLLGAGPAADAEAPVTPNAPDVLTTNRQRSR